MKQYQVDVWSGELHTEHGRRMTFDTWSAAAAFMEPLVDAGMLCNVIHQDYIAPADRVAEAKQKMAKSLRPPPPPNTPNKRA